MRGAWVLAATLLVGCYGDPDRFNAKQAELLCRLEDKCGGDWVAHSPGLDCENGREAELAECTAACTYDEDAARSCIRGIKSALRPPGIGRSCEYADGTLEDCARVYTDCDTVTDVGLMCDVPEPDVGCAVVPGTRPPWLGLLATACFIATVGRRRRRRIGVGVQPGATTSRASAVRSASGIATGRRVSRSTNTCTK